MQIDERLCAFFSRPLMAILAATDTTGRPSAGRGIGFHLTDRRDTIEVVFSAWQWPDLEAAITQTARLAVTFVSPADYVSFQLKGTATLRDTEPRDLDEAARFMAAARGELERLGVAPALITPWMTARGARLARIAISEIYVQTPGPLAGMLAGQDAT